jgi:hypothetical protein
MTDRLATLMHGEVESLEIPNAPAPEILATGRRMRRRRAWTRGAGAGVLVAAVATAAVVTHQGNDRTNNEPSQSPGLAPTTTYAVGPDLHLADGSTVTTPEFAQAMYYTSAGLVVRTNKDGSSDGGAPFHFELVKADGTTTKLGVTLGEVVPSTDPSEPYLAWATMTGGKIQVVVHDVSTDKDAATVDVPGTFDWGGWDAPPVSLVGDHVYVGTNDTTEVVDWRTGEATQSDVVPGSHFPDVHGAHAVIDGDKSEKVVDVATGKVLLDIPQTPSFVFVELSPDGRFATSSGGLGRATGGAFTVYDLAKGTSVDLKASDDGYGWSSDGDDLYTVVNRPAPDHGATMTTCVAATGTCHASAVPALPKEPTVRYPGITYEA